MDIIELIQLSFFGNNFSGKVLIEYGHFTKVAGFIAKTNGLRAGLAAIEEEQAYSCSRC